jgi:hypothetical protein
MALADRESLLKLGMQLEDTSIGRGVAEQQDQPGRAQVASLEQCLSFHGLDVGQAGLGLDQDETSRDEHCGVCSAQVAGNRNGDLCSQSDPRTKTTSEALEEPQVGPISHRIATGIEGARQLESQDGRDPRDEVDREGARISTFGPLDARGADAHPSGNLSNTQSRRGSRVRQLVRETLAQEPAALRAEVRNGLATCHVDENEEADSSRAYQSLTRQRVRD